jgi:site-specific DNA-adenine methylase
MKLHTFPAAMLGNKWKDIKDFCLFFPHPLSYDKLIEPFGGSFALTRWFGQNFGQKDLFSYYVNDIDKNLYFVYKHPKNFLKILDKYKDKTQKEIKEEYNQECPNKQFILEKFFPMGRDKTKDFNKNNYSDLLKFMKPINFSNDDFSKIMDRFKDDDQAFIFCDPPYFESCNTKYRLCDKLGNSIGKEIKDNTKMYIDLLYYLQASKAKIMLIINKNAITSYLYYDYIRGEYKKTYQWFKRKTKHLIITNYTNFMN